ncbi:VOC family protein [Brachybacterium sp. AOP43-C2-M15]|uniref:VOC family protein n=1 Tax=Brachybacterium sp. AOP43-C2-M15 TaxID=3457661 RepID=UPI00403394FA
MRITKRFMVLDAADPGAEAAFWAGVLGGEAVLAADEGPFAGWHEVIVDGRIELGVQPTPDHIAPTWKSPDPSAQRQQIHPDLYVAREDAPAAVQEVLALGARMLQEAEDPSVDGGFHVLADPAGHPFCICWE